MITLSELVSKIKELLLRQQKKMSLEQLANALSLQSNEEIFFLRNVLQELETSGLIYLNDSEEYISFPDDENLLIGKVRYDCQKRPFVLYGNRMIFIPDSHLNGALKGDIVLVKRNGYQLSGENKATIEKILKRYDSTLIFECRIKNGKKKIVPYNIPFSFHVSLSRKDWYKLKNGDRFCLNIDTTNHHGNFHGEIAFLIGHKKDPNLDIKTIAASHGIRIEFPDEVLKEAEEIPDFVSEEEVQKRIQEGGIDLREKLIFTIDDKSTQDMDDAISLEINEKGNYILGVHIADISYYVKEGSAIQKEAFKRGTSYYFPGLVIPMLPKKISYGIGSLRPNVDRLARSTEIEISKEGEILSYRVFKSVIRSKKKMSYEDLNRIFDQQQMVDGYHLFMPTLENMYAISRILDQKKKERGYINFGDKEIYIATDSNGTPTSIHLRKKGSSQGLIENFMLIDNQVMGIYPESTDNIGNNPAHIYRIHDLPNKDRINDILSYLIRSGYSIEKKDYSDPKEFQKLLASITHLQEYPAISDMLIRGMSKAKYSIHNIGHYGLALPYYTHFTSPGRRYSDLQTHYNQDKYENKIQGLLPSEEKQRLIEVCKHTTEVEKIADTVDREVTNYKLAQYMEDKIGESFIAMIIYISKHHVVIRTTEYITGTIPTAELLKLGYQLGNEGTTIIDPDSHQKLRIGDLIPVVLEEANTESKKIRFSLSRKEREKVYAKTGA